MTEIYKPPRCYPKYKNDRICDLCIYAITCKKASEKAIGHLLEKHKV